MRYFVLFVYLTFLGLSAQVDLADDPVSISLVKRQNDQFEIYLKIKDGYAFQKEAPHRILLAGKKGVTVLNANLTFQGPTHPKKPDYFAQVNPLPIKLTGKGELEVHARLFYCSLAKNLCIPGKLDTTLSVE